MSSSLEASLLKELDSGPQEPLTTPGACRMLFTALESTSSDTSCNSDKGEIRPISLFVSFADLVYIQAWTDAAISQEAAANDTL